jgi:uncharacterized protein with ParB-like and HNH nuclease domain
MSPPTIQGTERPIAKIFSDDYAFTIPNYQRPYAWTTEEASELFDDLLTAMENGKRPIKDLNPYFLGSVVLIKEENDPDAQIVDGQQRLVTLTILLSAVRSLVGKKQALDISKRIYEKGDSILDTPNRYRLMIRQRDQDFFQKYIQDEDGIDELDDLDEHLPESCKNIRENALLFISKLKKLKDEHRLTLAKYITRQCYLVIVSTPDLDSAFRIFSVLNDRGLDLSLTDILKAEIIGKIGKASEEDYTQKWEELEEQLGRDPFSDLFAHIRMIHARKKLRATVLQEFREFVNPTKKPKPFIDDILIPMGEAFDQIANASFEGTKRVDEINRYLTYLNRIDNFDWQPPAILYMTLNRNKTRKVLRFLQKLERLAASMMIIRADINYRLERYGRLIKSIQDDEDVFNDDSPLQLTSSEQGKVITALDGDIYKVVKIRVPVLLRLDEALTEGEASYSFPIISVEHVLPQTPPMKSKWLEWWPDEEEREDNLHRLGNLALLSRRKNSQAKNYDFEKKKGKYFKRGGVSPFALTTQVLNESKWTPEVVEERQKQLLAKLKDIWDLTMPIRRFRRRINI